jgi:predicted HTH domain antitoxin
MKLEVEINVAEGTVDKHELAERVRKETILALFADRKIPAGQAARELGLGRLEFMELLKERGIPYVIYTFEEWEADGRAIEELERRRLDR